MAGEIELELPRATLLAPVDAPPVTTTVIVRNRGSVVDNFTLSVEGIDPAWWEIAPPSVSLFPGEEGSATLSIHLPPGAVAGAKSAQLRAVSTDDPGRTASAPLTLNVVAAGSVAMSLDPRASAGRTGKHAVTITSRRNAEVHLTLAGADADEALVYTFLPAALSLAPFAEATADLEVRPKSAPLWGASRQHTFSVRALAEGEEEPAAESEGELEYRPLVGPASLPAGRWRWLLALVPLFALALLLRPLLGPGGAEPAASPTKGAGAAVAAGAQAGGAGGAGPLIVSLTADRGEAEALRAVLVSWEVERGDTIQGNLRDAAVGPVGDPSWKGTYQLDATGSGGSATEEVQVVVLGPPIIRQFYAMPSTVPEGGTARFTLEVLSADEVDIEGKQVNPTAKVWELPNVRADQSGWYILRARNAVGEVSSITYLTVGPPPAPGATATPTATGTATRTVTPTATLPGPIIASPTPTPTATAAATPTFTPTATATTPPTFTPTPVAPCGIKAFSISPTYVAAGRWGGSITFNWQASNVDYVVISWTDANGAHSVTDKRAVGSIAQDIWIGAPGSVTFNLHGYRGTPGTRTEPCVGPATATFWLSHITSLTVSSRICDGFREAIDISWQAVGGPETRLALYRNDGMQLPINATQLKGTFRDYPPVSAVAVTSVNYRLVLTVPGGSETRTEPKTPVRVDPCPAVIPIPTIIRPLPLPTPTPVLRIPIPTVIRR